MAEHRTPDDYEQAEEGLTLAYRATRPGEYGVVVHPEPTDVFLGLGQEAVELWVADDGEQACAPVEANIDSVLAAMRAPVRAMLRDLCEELADSETDCVLIRLTLTGAAQENWSAVLHAAAELPENTRVERE